MKQADLNRAVARATGETVSTIKRFGFLMADLPHPEFDPEPSDLDHYIDWDEVDEQRYASHTC